MTKCWRCFSIIRAPASPPPPRPYPFKPLSVVISTINAPACVAKGPRQSTCAVWVAGFCHCPLANPKLGHCARVQIDVPCPNSDDGMPRFRTFFPCSREFVFIGMHKTIPSKIWVGVVIAYHRSRWQREITDACKYPDNHP